MTMHAYSFLSAKSAVQSGPPPIATLSFHPDGPYNGDFQLMFRQSEPIEQQLAIAERILSGVTRWRDGIAGYAEQQRTAADELAEARAEIERLKSEAGEVHV